MELKTYLAYILPELLLAATAGMIMLYELSERKAARRIFRGIFKL